jgi:hypothetical protein
MLNIPSEYERDNSPAKLKYISRKIFSLLRHKVSPGIRFEAFTATKFNKFNKIVVVESRKLSTFNHLTRLEARENFSVSWYLSENSGGSTRND